MEITWELETERAELRSARVATEHEMAEQAVEDAATAESVWMDLVAAFSRETVSVEAVEPAPAPVVTPAPVRMSFPRRALSVLRRTFRLTA